MAVTNFMMRRTVVPLAVRMISNRTQSYHHGSSALFATVVNPSYASRNFFWSSAPSSSILHCWYSTKKHSSDKSILKTIGSEIQRLEETDEVEEEDDFPFKIKDNPGQQFITLTREYKGETIDIKVYMPEEVTDSDDDEEEETNNNDDETQKDDENKNDDDTDTNDETDSDDAERETKIDVVVKVSKKNVQTLEFDLTGFADDDFAIDRLSIKDPNAAKGQYHQCSPYGFSDFDEKIRKAFYKYLENRGIKTSTTKFLHEYMVNKNNKEYVMYLKNLKKIIEA
ncbi:putative protein NEDD1-like [Capsicum annuum]|nr:putative protein NEDD1-like [Capsicum annuum]